MGGRVRKKEERRKRRKGVRQIPFVRWLVHFLHPKKILVFVFFVSSLFYFFFFLSHPTRHPSIRSSPLPFCKQKKKTPLHLGSFHTVVRRSMSSIQIEKMDLEWNGTEIDDGMMDEGRVR